VALLRGLLKSSQNVASLPLNSPTDLILAKLLGLEFECCIAGRRKGASGQAGTLFDDDKGPNGAFIF
jgi:hypothetical protein